MAAMLSFWVTILSLLYCFSCNAMEVSYDGRALKIDGERRIIIFGSMHYPRSTPEMWPSLMNKSKDGGLNGIDTYVFWNYHEPSYRQYDFSGNRDLIRFLKTIQDAGMYALLRIGPYVTAEWNYGGFPVWLHNMPNMTFRTKNDVFLNEVNIFTTMIVDMVKKEKLFASQGGPVILAQIENEYGGMRKHYGEDGEYYINWCANLAVSLNISIPWIMCEDRTAPEPMIDTCNGYYGDRFYPRNPNMPKIWTENWTGWVKKWGDKDSHRPVEETAFAVARFFQYGGTSENYYMYHGGTNFGRTAGGPYVTTSYNFDAPLDEYGNLNQPTWGHLKQLHNLLMSMEKILTYGVVTKTDYGNMVDATMFTHNGTRACFFGNANDTSDMTINFEGKNYTIPSWSVTILPDCRTEVYNTAQVNTQTSIMVKKTSEFDNEPENLEWTWRPERIEGSLKSRKGVTFANQLLEQKSVTNDTTDYLWYMTSVDIERNDPVWGEEVTLQVSTHGHVLHVFLNGEHVGTQFGRNLSDLKFTFEQIVKMKHGNNSISLLSATVGLEDYGPRYEKRANGILGPVRLIAPNSEVKDLSNNEWAYKVGLNGLEKGFYRDDKHHHKKWLRENLPFNRMFVWYKTTFKTPVGEDPVALDLFGMGKGYAWVNEHNIGRYWSSFIADINGCNPSCDYRGRHNDKKCMKNCGVPSQRWYHVPRSFLNEEGGNNTLILFEEFGGKPLNNVRVQTVTVGKACGNAYEGNRLELSCQGGKVISEIRFSSFGNPTGVCGSFERGTCDSPDTSSVIQKACVGKKSCSIDVSETNFEPNHCKNIKKRLAVEAIC